jgi:hypothetical protein
MALDICPVNSSPRALATTIVKLSTVLAESHETKYRAGYLETTSGWWSADFANPAWTKYRHSRGILQQAC